jgi:acetyl-CoA carboxylase carboxyl transferase subunit beta
MALRRFRFRRKKEMPDGLWIKCQSCNQMVFKKIVEERLNVCPECNYHFTIPSQKRIELLLDAGSFEERYADMTSLDPLGFIDRITYPERLHSEQEKTGLKDAVVVGTGKIEGRRIMFAVTDFNFLAGSLGSVMGEKITRIVEEAQEEGLPLIIVSGSGGGARMQEGALSLSQMAKTSAAIARFHDAGGVYISILTNPCMAGVMASFASLGDVVIAEPKALIGFTGPRVIRQTIQAELPEGFQRSEFLLERGLIDMIISRKNLKKEVARLLNYLAPVS